MKRAKVDDPKPWDYENKKPFPIKKLTPGVTS